MQYKYLLSSALAFHFSLSTALPTDETLVTPNAAQVVVDELQGFVIDNTCGPRAQKICKLSNPGGGACCSQWGFCGNRPEYCGSGCQKEYSHGRKCQPATKPRHKPGKLRRCGAHHKNKKCPNSQCCSANGFCGTSKNFCGVSCQEKFGVCHKNPSPDVHFPDRCGPKHNHQKCGPGFCCSGAGYCGKGAEYCGVPLNCQRKFGWCDDKVIPAGYNTSSDPRPFSKSLKIQIPILKCTEPHTVALTFDDGPSKYTDALLRLLKHYNARATFFLAGNINGKGQIDIQWKEPIRRMIAQGHQVASHSWSHPNMTKLPTYLRREDMVKNERAITNVIGKYPSFMRAPYIQCDSSCQQDMKDLGYYLANWEWDSQDWIDKPKTDVAKQHFDIAFEKIKDRADGNLFVIQHDTHEGVLKLTKHILRKLKKTKGWKAVPLVECLGLSLDNAYRYPNLLEPATVSQGACLVSGFNYCITVKPFKNKKQCFKSAKQTDRLVADCKNKNKAPKTSKLPISNDCAQAINVLRKQQQFCSQCDDRKGECVVSKFKIQAWQPAY